MGIDLDTHKLLVKLGPHPDQHRVFQFSHEESKGSSNTVLISPGEGGQDTLKISSTLVQGGSGSWTGAYVLTDSKGERLAISFSSGDTAFDHHGVIYYYP